MFLKTKRKKKALVPLRYIQPKPYASARGPYLTPMHAQAIRSKTRPYGSGPLLKKDSLDVRPRCCTALFDAHPHYPITSIRHALEANPALAIMSPTRGSRRVARRARASRLAGRIVASPVTVAAGSRSPWRDVPLHRALNDGRVVRAHPRAHGPPLENIWVKVVVAPAFVVDSSSDLGCTRRLWSKAMQWL